jgi:hypothetical protein
MVSVHAQRRCPVKPELFWLALTATMTGLFWIPYILNRAVRRGVPAAFLTPKMEEAPVEAECAQRAKRAHYTAVENLVVFTRARRPEDE